MAHVCTCDDCQAAPYADVCKYEAGLREAVRLLDDARCDLNDPILRRRWGLQRKALRGILDPALRP